jgi:hypothetical protein
MKESSISEKQGQLELEILGYIGVFQSSPAHSAQVATQQAGHAKMWKVGGWKGGWAAIVSDFVTVPLLHCVIDFCVFAMCWQVGSGSG